MARSRYPLAAALLLACSVAAGEADRTAARPLVILMRDELRAALGRIADTATVEHFRCLYGIAQPDTVYLTAAFEPTIHRATTMGLNHDPCPGVALAEWHTHLSGVTTTGEIRRDWDPRASCYLSSIDIRAARGYHSAKILFVQVDAKTLCWWTQAQVIGMGTVNMLPALDGQRFGWGP
jgi:hypothetical protein